MEITEPQYYRDFQHVEPTVVVTSRTGVRFRVHLLRKGDRYGLEDCLTWDRDREGVEFYDTRFPHTKRGQFVGRYFAETLLDDSDGRGLDLGSSDNWVIDAAAMDVVRAWLHLEVNRVLAPAPEPIDD